MPSELDPSPRPEGDAPSLMRLAAYFLRLGTLGFGGPIALAGYMQRDLVERRGWIAPYPDSLHADRFILVGFSHRHRLLYVVHAEVTADVIRIISARKATRHEKAHYEND